MHIQASVGRRDAGAARPGDDVLRVAWLSAVIPAYRLPFLERLSRTPGLDVTCFHGAGRPGWSVRSIGRQLPVKSVWVGNVYWPFGGGRVAWQFAFGRLIRGDFDVIVCSEAVHNLLVWALWALRRVHRKPLVLYGYAFRPQAPSAGAGVRDGLRRILLRASGAVIAYTEAGRAACLEAGLPPDKVFVSGNTLDTESLMALERHISMDELRRLRRRLGLDHGPVLLFVGRLNPVKRVDVLVDAMRRLRAALPAASLMIIGEGREDRLLAGRARGAAGIHLLGPIYDELELARHFLLADLLVIPGRVGLACVHGFCYGVPVVTTRTGVEQSPEVAYVAHGTNGYLVDRPDPILYADAIAHLLADRERLEQMRSAARETARSLTMARTVAQFGAAVRSARHARIHS